MTLVLKLLDDSSDIVFAKPSSGYMEKLKTVLDKCKKKTNGYVSVTLDRPYKPRTVGDKSQNNLIWKLITIIANEVGDDSEGMIDTENGIKMRALSRGYPFRVSKVTGEKVPLSMKKINTVECSYLIDTAYEVISELGIILPPNLNELKNGTLV